MDTAIPIPSNIPRGAPFAPMGQGFPAPMVPTGAMRPPNMPAPLMNPIEASVKATEFTKAVYVSGFEKTLTAEMLQDHFKLKPIVALKLPLNKYRQNKGFAFIYYQSADDAAYVKQKLDYTAILRSKIRVTKAVTSENLSKMMFKLKTEGLTKEQVQAAKQKYFNERNLQKQVSKIINPIFSDSVEVNKIIIPSLKINGKASANGETLDYARAFFHVSQLKKASRNLNIQGQFNDNNTRKDYQLILKSIVQNLNAHPQFSKYARAEVYDYSSKNKTNILHLKHIAIKNDQNPEKVAEQLKAVIQEHLRQSKINQVFVGTFNKTGAWANVSFSEVAEAQEAYKYFKNNKVKFRDTNICGTLSNVKDLRTVVVSTVKNGATEQEIRSFLNKLAQRSPRYDFNDQTKGRKYDFIGFSILEKKTYYHVSSDAPSVGLEEKQQPKDSWIEQNEVPRRIVIDFEHDISERDLKQLQADIKLSDDFNNIFIEKDLKHQVRAGHQKGHYKGLKYTKHIDQQKKKPEPTKENKGPRPPMGGQRRPFDANQYNFNRNQNRGAPRNVGGAQNRQGFVPPVRTGIPQAPVRPMGQMGPIPGVGMMPPKMGPVPTPVMGLAVPPMGVANKAPSNVIPMGGMPPPMGLPPMGAPMGFQVPPMGAMGAPKMGLPQPNLLPPQQKKQ